jgi:hypothetical protein
MFDADQKKKEKEGWKLGALMSVENFSQVGSPCDDKIREERALKLS